MKNLYPAQQSMLSASIAQSLDIQPYNHDAASEFHSEVMIYTFSDEDRKSLQAILRQAPSPYTRHFRSSHEYSLFVLQNLPYDLLRMLNDLHCNPKAPKFFVLLNCPRDHHLGVPDPQGKPPGDKRTFVAEGFSTSIVAALSCHPVAMQNEWFEEPVQNLVQVESKVDEQSSASSGVNLAFHGDDLPSGDKRIAWTLLRLVQAPSKRPYTVVADAAKANAFLRAHDRGEVVDMLYRNKARGVAPASQRGGKALEELPQSEASPLLSGPEDSPRCFLEYLGDTLDLDSDNNPDKDAIVWDAIKAYRNALDGVAIKLKLPQNGLIGFNNRSGFHGRLKWRASFTKSELRWGIRVNAVADPFLSRDHDVHLLSAFRDPKG